MRIQVSALEKNQAGPDRTDRSPACSHHRRRGREEGGDAPGGRDKEGEGEGRPCHGLRQGERKAGEWLPRRPRPPELLLRLRANGDPRGERPFGEHKARLRPLPPIRRTFATTALSSECGLGK